MNFINKCKLYQGTRVFSGTKINMLALYVLKRDKKIIYLYALLVSVMIYEKYYFPFILKNII